MDILFNNFGILKSNESIDLFSEYVDNIFIPNGNILSTYNFIRSNEILAKDDKIEFMKATTKNYIDMKFSSINSVGTCLCQLNDVNNKMLKIRMLFNYLKNRKSQDIFVEFLDIYYQMVIQHIAVFIIHVFTPLADKSVPPYILKQAEESYDLIVNGLNYHYETWDINKKMSDDEKKKILSDALLLHNKYGSVIIEEFGNVIKFYFKSFKTLKFSDLVTDFKLAEHMCKYEGKISQHIQDANIDYKYKFRNLISKTPVIQILSNTNVYTCDQIFYDLVLSQITNNPNSDLDIYLEKLICGIETNIIITNEKYKSEQLFLDIAKTFRVLSKMLDSWALANQKVKTWVVQTINNVLAQDEILVNYLVTSMVIFVRKISTNNFTVLKELVSNVSKCIAVSNKESQFLDLFNQNLQNNLIKTKINEELFGYISTIIDHFDSNGSNYIKIKKFLYEIEINVCYNSEVSQVKVKSNKNISVNMELSNTILINKDVWKTKSQNPKIKIPDSVLIYFKVYEQFYMKKHSFRSIEWCYENSTIEIDIGPTTISGSVIPVSILVIIGSNPNISESELCKQLEINNLEPVSKYIELLEMSGIVGKSYLDKQSSTSTSENQYNINSNLPPMINLNKLAVSKQKQVKPQEDSFDINNSTDCWIIKSLKPLNGSGLNLKDLVEKVNSSNKYFKVDEAFIKTRLETLEKKNYVVFSNSMYMYDV